MKKIAGDQGPRVLGFPVIGVVVARAEGVGAEQDAALDLGAKAFIAATRTFRRGLGLRGARVIAHAVKASQVRRGLGGGNDVVDRDGVTGVRQRIDFTSQPPAQAVQRARWPRECRVRPSPKYSLGKPTRRPSPGFPIAPK